MLGLADVLGQGSSDDSGTVVMILLVLLVLGVFTFATLVEVLRLPPTAPLQSGTKATWVVVILLTGVIGAVLYQVAGKPSAEPPNEGHELLYDGVKALYWCQDCPYETTSVGAARLHRDTGVSSSSAVPAIPAGLTTIASPSSTSHDFKVCPDCAEEVRAAARKCRFCGYQFQAQAAS